MNFYFSWIIAWSYILTIIRTFFVPNFSLTIIVNSQWTVGTCTIFIPRVCTFNQNSYFLFIIIDCNVGIITIIILAVPIILNTSTVWILAPYIRYPFSTITLIVNNNFSCVLYRFCIRLRCCRSWIITFCICCWLRIILLSCSRCSLIIYIFCFILFISRYMICILLCLFGVICCLICVNFSGFNIVSPSCTKPKAQNGWCTNKYAFTSTVTVFIFIHYSFLLFEYFRTSVY